MTQNFCEHLDEYGVAFGRAKASYGNCLNLMEKIIADSTDNELRRTMENSLDEWVLETRNLRALFTKMHNDGDIEISRIGETENEESLDHPIAICRNCDFQIPRLEFTEFDLTDENKPTYRGQPLPLPAGAGV